MTAPRHMARSGASGRRTALVVLGALVAFLGMIAASVGASLLWIHATQRDADGFFATDTTRFSTSTYALTKDIDLGDADGEARVRRSIGTLRIEAHPAGDGLFVGIGPTEAVHAYLRNVAHEEVRGADFGPFDTNQSLVSGTNAPAAPGTQSFWESAVAGKRSTEELRWPSQRGEWTIVMMNADASPGVRADLSVGLKTNLLMGVGVAGVLTAFVLFAGASALLFLGLRHQVAAGASAEAPEARNPASYPARLTGHLDEGLSRWLWIVKPILLIPHAIALAFLWIATSMLTIAAGVAILFTGRYPRGIFDFNVGVVRWTWRVGFYGFNALGTDKYPPFSLQSDPDYPADFTVAYPERLSRGLVLVKWWLLAIPHYLIVAVFTGGWGMGFSGPRMLTGAGLITLLAVVAGVVLLVKGQYPASLFEFVMGLNRWCYRVLPYVALMRDEYPPFRLDAGGTDPGDVPTRPRPDTPMPAVPAPA